MTTANEAPFSSKEVLADGIVSLLKPAVEEIDERVMAVRFVTLECFKVDLLLGIINFLLQEF